MKNSLKKESKVIILTGPTASGKSKAIYSLPLHLPVEIINADSRQVYCDLKIGTAMPKLEELNKFPHHLYAFLGIEEKMTVGYFFYRAKELIEDIISRNKVPIICGGTFYYIKTLLDGLYEEPEIKKETREKVQSLDFSQKLQIVKDRDPEFYEKMDKNNPARLDRAVLLVLSSDKKISEYKKEQGIRNKYQIEILCPNVERKALYQQIEERTKRMFAEGFLDEILQLKAKNVKPSAFGVNAIGYREILQMAWEKNWKSVDEIEDSLKKFFIQLVVQKTRNLAKRQMTWLKKEKMLKKVDPFVLPQYLTELIESTFAR